jgi:hypothetical protein
VRQHCEQLALLRVDAARVADGVEVGLEARARAVAPGPGPLCPRQRRLEAHLQLRGPRREHVGQRQPADEQRRRADRLPGVPGHPAARAQQRARRTRADRQLLAHAAQVLGQLERARIAPLALALQGLLQHHHQVARQVVPEAARVGQRVVEDALVHALGARVLERPAQRQALVQHHAQRVDVRAPVELAGARGELLGRHVGRRSRVESRRRQRGQLRVALARQAEVQDHRLAAGRDHQVGRLDVAVDDAGLVRGVQRARRALDELHAAQQRPAARGAGGALGRVGRGGRADPGLRVVARARRRDRLRQRLALDEAHRDEERAVRGPDLVHGADPGVVELGGQLGLAPQPRLRAAAQRAADPRRAGVEEHLERHLAPQARVEREVDDTLAALAELAQQPVGAERAEVLRLAARVRRRARVPRAQAGGERAQPRALLGGELRPVRQECLDVDRGATQHRVEILLEQALQAVRHGEEFQSSGRAAELGAAD